MIKKHFTTGLAIVALCLLGVFTITNIVGCGQQTSTSTGASITGKVYDKTGKAASGVTVKLKVATAQSSSVRTLSTTSETTTTGSDGSFSFNDVSDGSYTVQADQSDQYKVVQGNIVISGGVSVNLGTLTLAETGAIQGNAYFVDKATHAGIDVYIPGTSFVAKTAASGAFGQ